MKCGVDKGGTFDVGILESKNAKARDAYSPITFTLTVDCAGRYQNYKNIGSKIQYKNEAQYDAWAHQQLHPVSS